MYQRLIVRQRMVCLALLASAITGCGSGDAQQADTGPISKKVAVAAPEQVLTAFLDAARNGNKEESRKWLTAKTLEECAKHDMEVNPPGTPSMSYEIGRVADAPQIPGGIFVESTWTEELADGKVEMDVLWAMRKDQGQWRICGMVIQLEEDTDPVLFDFENKADEVAALIRGSGQQPPKNAPNDKQGVVRPITAEVIDKPTVIR
jgi:hypothetical protein